MRPSVSSQPGSRQADTSLYRSAPASNAARATTGLMVSTEEIETMCRLARGLGALGAKLTGSGGGGCVVALVEGDPAPIVERWEKEGFRAFSTTVSSSRTAAERLPSP